MKSSFVDLQKQVKKFEDKSNNLSKELNLLRKQLNSVNKEWEKWKTELTLFKNYEGILKKVICKNTQNNRKELCDNQIIPEIK